MITGCSPRSTSWDQAPHGRPHRMIGHMARCATHHAGSEKSPPLPDAAALGLAVRFRWSNSSFGVPTMVKTESLSRPRRVARKQPRRRWPVLAPTLLFGLALVVFAQIL